jgi:hypothetical protein
LWCEVEKSWKQFYSVRAIFKRIRSGPLARLSLTGKLFYGVACIGFMSLYPNGIAADNVRQQNLGFFDRLCLRLVIMLTRRKRDLFFFRRQTGRPKPEVFASEPHGPTFGAELR